MQLWLTEGNKCNCVSTCTETEQALAGVNTAYWYYTQSAIDKYASECAGHTPSTFTPGGTCTANLLHETVLGDTPLDVRPVADWADCCSQCNNTADCWGW